MRKEAQQRRELEQKELGRKVAAEAAKRQQAAREIEDIKRKKAEK